MTKSASELVELISSTYREQSGIVYVVSPSAAERVAAVLTKGGIRAASYHGRMSHQERSRVLEAWVARELHVVVGTSAFGMGINMLECRFVIHLQAPSSLTALKQRSGRAGRDGKPGAVHLFTAPSDVRIWASIFSQSACEQAQTERRKMGEDLLDAQTLQNEVVRRTAPAHVKLREVMSFSSSCVCRRWALEVGMREVFMSRKPLSLCVDGAQCCDCCTSGKSVSSTDVTAAARLMLAIVLERGGLVEDDLVAVFSCSSAKNVSANLKSMTTYRADHDLRTSLLRFTKTLGEFVLDALVVCGLVEMKVVVPDMVVDELDEEEEEVVSGAAPIRRKRIACHVDYWPAPSATLDQIVSIFCHKP